jgi:hypothetical protein
VGKGGSRWYPGDGKRALPYLICDGGYPKRPLLICPFKDQLEGSDMHFCSKHIESLRKDVECTFGILKRRFMILKHAVRLHNIEDLEHVFRTCCILHNILLAHDGRDDWEAIYDDDPDDDCLDDLTDFVLPVDTNGRTSFGRGERRSYQDREAVGEAFVDETAKDAFMTRRDDLIEHYSALCDRREIDL